MNHGTNAPTRDTRSASIRHSTQAPAAQWGSPLPSGNSRYSLQPAPHPPASYIPTQDERPQHYPSPRASAAAVRSRELPHEATHLQPTSRGDLNGFTSSSRVAGLDRESYNATADFHRGSGEAGDQTTVGGDENYNDNAEDLVNYIRYRDENGHTAESDAAFAAGAMPRNPYVRAPNPAPRDSSTGPLISSDVHNRVVSAFELSEHAERRLEGFALLMSCVPGIGKETTIPLFYNLGASLRIIDMLDRQAVKVPAIEQISSMCEKLDNRLGATTLLVSTPIKKNITALVKAMLVDPKRYDYTALFTQLKARLAKEKATYGLLEHFKDATAIEALHSQCSKIVSSQIGALREDILKSVGLKGKTPTTMSLAAFTLRVQSKYGGAATGASSTITMKHLVHCAVLRRFVLDHPNAKDLEETVVPAKRKHGEMESPSPFGSPSSSSSVSDSHAGPSSQSSTPTEARTLIDCKGEVVPCPELPAQVHFWRVFEWHLHIVRIMHGEIGTDGWKKYVSDIIDDDEYKFNRSGEEYVTGVSHLLMKEPADGSGSTASSSGTDAAPTVEFANTQV